MLLNEFRLLRKYKLQHGLLLTEYYFNQNGNCNSWGKRNVHLFNIKQSCYRVAIFCDIIK